MKSAENKKMGLGQRTYTTLLLALVALVGITAATAAWFSIADRTDVNNMALEVTVGPSLRFDLVPHDAFEDYYQTLSFEDISAAVQRELGYDMHTVPLKPVTTVNADTFTYRDGTVVPASDGAYWTYTLHFMASEDMIVHVTSSNEVGEDGTLVSSSKPTLPQSMRMSMTADGNTYVYDPGMGNSQTNIGNIKNFGLPNALDMVYTNVNALFSMKKGEDKTVVFHIWMEGTDEACTDELKNSDFSIRLRFEGTDEAGNRLSGKTPRA